MTVEKGLERTVQWYLDNEDWWRALQDRRGRRHTGGHGMSLLVFGKTGQVATELASARRVTCFWTATRPI